MKHFVAFGQSRFHASRNFLAHVELATGCFWCFVDPYPVPVILRMRDTCRAERGFQTSVQGFSSWLSKNRDENPRMRALLVGLLNWKFCACADSRRDFWTTNWKIPVQGFSGPLSRKSDENRRMRAFWREFFFFFFFFFFFQSEWQ